MKKIINKLKNIDKNYLIILITTIILMMPLISTKINNVEGHDMAYHLANIKGMTSQILSLNFTKISPIIGNGFGYGGAIFYPKLPHTIAGIIGLFTSFINNNEFYTLKICNILLVFLSGIVMYKLLLKLFNNKNISLLGSIFYITMPYFMTNIYVRTAFNESFMYLFMPMILIGIVDLLNKNYKSFYIYFILGYIGIINSHLVLSVYFTFIVLIILLINYKKILKKENIKRLIISSILILILVMPSVIMMLEHKALNIYTVFDSNAMNASSINIKANGLSVFDYIQPEIRYGNNIYVFINIVVIIFCLMSVIYLVKYEKNKQTKQLVLSILVALIISMLFSYHKFPYQYIPKLLLSVQFGFRFVLFIGLFISIFASYGLNLITTKNEENIKNISIILCCLIVLPFINNTTFIKINDISYDYNQGMGWQKEYLTKYTSANIDYFNERDNKIKINNDENIKIEKVKDDVPYLEFKVSNIKNKTIELEIPRLYYLGYDIKLITNNKTKKLKYNPGDKGFITFEVEENGIIKVDYTGTVLYKLSKVLRLITIVVLGIYLLKGKIKSKKFA